MNPDNSGPGQFTHHFMQIVQIRLMGRKLKSSFTPQPTLYTALQPGGPPQQRSLVYESLLH